MTRPAADPGTGAGTDPMAGSRTGRLLVGGTVLVVAIVGWAALVWWSATPGSGRPAFGRPGPAGTTALLLVVAAVVLGAALLPIGRAARTIVAVGAVVLVTALGVAGHDAALGRRLDAIVDDLAVATRAEQQVPKVGTAPCRPPLDRAVYERLGLPVDEVCVFGGTFPEVHLVQTGPDTDLGHPVRHGLVYAPSGVVTSMDVCVHQVRDQWWERSGLVGGGVSCPSGYDFRGGG